MGAPVVALCRGKTLEVWKQSDEPEFLGSLQPHEISGFFARHAEELSPDAILRAKTFGRPEGYQLSFVDSGLMPIVEQEMGHWLGRLIKRVIEVIHCEASPDKITPQFEEWIYKSSFWLLAAKILQDKEVPDFVGLDLTDLEAVFKSVAAHYGASTESIPIVTKARQGALSTAVQILSKFSSLRHVTTESLAQIYEETLVDKGIRKELGIHRTLPFLVDYIIGRIEGLVGKIPEKERDVLEIGCGPATFLLGAMRLLRFLSSSGDLRLQERLHGLEIDPFAREIGRLSLTLADVPNPDGWDLRGDLFLGGDLDSLASKATIFLANPPFEDFKAEDKERYESIAGRKLLKNKAAASLHLTLDALPQGAVFAFIAPQSHLTARHALSLRRLIASQCEIREICLLPDAQGVWSRSSFETAVIIGTKKPPTGLHQLLYKRVREHGIRAFISKYEASECRMVSQSHFLQTDSIQMWFPATMSEEFWRVVEQLPRLGEIAHVERGVEFKSKKILPQVPRFLEDETEGFEAGFHFARGARYIHTTPKLHYLNLSQDVVQNYRGGIPESKLDQGGQVIVPYAPRSRSPWLVSAFIVRGCFSRNFLGVQRKCDYPLEYLWALLNSPLANAFLYSWSKKRHVLEGKMQELPIPRADIGAVDPVVKAAADYRSYVSRQFMQAIDQVHARDLLLRMDAEILRLYDLPSRMERQMLDLFSGHQRIGLPFDFIEYFPAEFKSFVPLHVYISPEFQRSTIGEFRKSIQSAPSLFRSAAGTAGEVFGGE